MMAGVWLRSWRRSPLLTGQFAFTVAIGMGAASALVSLMLALGYQPLPFRDPGHLAVVWERSRSGGSILAISGPDVTDFADATHSVFSSFGAFSPPNQLWLFDRKGSAQVPTCYIQASVFSDLGIRPISGRGARQDDQPLGSSVTSPAWISYRLWHSRYGGSPSAIGMTVGIAEDATGLNRVAAQIAGVLPPGVSIPLPFEDIQIDVWYLAPRDISNRSRQSDVFFGLGRLRPKVTVEQAQAALTVVAEHLGQQYSFDSQRIPVVQSLEAIAQGPARKTMGLLMLGVAFVILLGCANVAILIGAEGKRRRREIAIRSALGASRSRLWYEAAAEKCLLTLLSLGIGVWLAFAFLRVLTKLVPAAGLGPALEHPPPLNLDVLLGFVAFALAASLIWAALLIGAADAPDSMHTLAAAGSGLGYTGPSVATPQVGRWQWMLLAAQAAIGICLLSAASLAASTYAKVAAANLGPAPRQTVLLRVSSRDHFVPSDAQITDFDQQVLSRLARLPGTQAVALAAMFPPPSFPVSFTKEGDGPGAERDAAGPAPVSLDYFRTLGIPILFGRSFDGTDSSGGEPVAIISLNMAEKNWNPPQQAVGSEIAVGTKSHYKIVGVAANFTGYWSQTPVPTIYLPLAQSAYSCGGEVILRTAGSPQSVATLAPQLLNGMAMSATISDVSTMQARWQATLTRPTARMAGMVLLALLGLGLSVQGVYAVAAGTVATRRHELAIRAALGALPNRLAWDLTRQLVIAVLIGAALGVVAAVNLQPLLQHWLGPAAVWQAEPIAVAVVLLVIAAAAGSYLPARSASRTNPAEVLRQG